MDAEPHVALLRGVNVGGKNKLPMADLARICRGLGCVEPRTYIQSGNVVFGADQALAGSLPGLLAGRILDEFGLKVPAIVRSLPELAGVVAANPFLAEGMDPSALHVLFLADLPDPARVEALDPDRSPPDSFRVVGREVFLHCPKGFADTKLTNAYFDSRLATVSTARNWRTVLKLLAMAAGTE